MRYSVSVPIGGSVSYNFTQADLQLLLSKLWIELPGGRISNSKQFLGPWPTGSRSGGPSEVAWSMMSVYRLSEIAIRSTWDIVNTPKGWRLQYLGVKPTSASNIDTTLPWSPPEGLEIFLVLRVPIKSAFIPLGPVLRDSIKVEILRDNGIGNYIVYMFMRRGSLPPRTAPLPNVWTDSGKMCTGTLGTEAAKASEQLGPAFVFGDKLFEHVQTTPWNRDLAPSDLNQVLQFDAEGKPLPLNVEEVWRQGRESVDSVAAGRLLQVAFPVAGAPAEADEEDD